MLELTENDASRWGRSIGIGSLRLAEQDYRLVELVRAINEDEFLSDRLVFKGGTALNKLYYRDNARLSVDLDFNVLGTRDSVQDERSEMRDRLLEVLREQDPDFDTYHEHSWEMLRVVGRYQPLAGGEQEKIKIECSTVERFPITETVTRELEMPDGSTVDIRTLPIDELIATKVRAYYARRQGRDVYDLTQAYPLLEDTELLRKMAIYYFYRSQIVYDPDEIHEAMTDESQVRGFRQDIQSFLRADVDFDIEQAFSQLPEAYEFLFDLDERDEEFILLARHLLDKVGEKRAAEVLEHEHPLAWLFEGHSGISERALEATHDTIYVHTED